MNLITKISLLSVCIAVIQCNPGSHGGRSDGSEGRSNGHQNRRGPGGGGYHGHGHHHGGYGNVDWDTTKTCADDFTDNNGNCDSFRKCCENLCESSGGYQADCVIDSSKEARMRCSCNGGGGGGGGNGGSDGGDQTGETPPMRQWRPPRTRPPVVAQTEVVTYAPARPAGGNQGCGVPTIQPTARIVGGTEAKPHSWPWQISLQYKGRHLCGGSLISSGHILTAAHCFELSTRASDYKIVLGMHDRQATGSTTVSVSKIHVNPKYNADANSYDSAIAVLSKPVTFSDSVTPVCLPQQDVADGASCEATGWGSTQGTGNNRYLLQVRVPIIARSVCNDRQHYNGMIDSTMTCAGATGKDSCQGDSGGPLVCQRSDGVWEQQGITSWGSDCAQYDKPGVYSRVTASLSWINQIINS